MVYTQIQRQCVTERLNVAVNRIKENSSDMKLVGELETALFESCCQDSPGFCFRRFLALLRFDGDLVMEVSTSRTSEPVEEKMKKENK